MKTEKILIVGASGTVGSEAARILTAQGYQVRGTTSKKTSLPKNGIEWVHVNLITGEGVEGAFKGVDRAFLLSPPGYADQFKILAPLIQEAKKNHLKKVVLMTAFGANAVETSPFRRAEIDLEKSGLPFNVVRPNWFMQNFNTFWVQGILEKKKILLPAGSAKVSFIDARDISAVIAQLLVKDDFNNRAFDITGPEAIDHAEVAKTISEEIGQKIAYQEISPNEFRQGLLGAGLPEAYSDFLVMIMGFLKEGYNSQVNQEVAKILGRSPLSLKEYAKDYKKSWI